MTARAWSRLLAVVEMTDEPTAPEGVERGEG